MKKNENLEKIYLLAQEAGLSSKDVAEYLSARECDPSSASKTYETPKEIYPGMFVYTDGLIYPEIIPYRQIKAVVVRAESKTVLAACLERVSLPWSSDGLRVERTRDMTDGTEATRKILEFARKTKKHAEAAQFCYDYAKNGVKQGEAFLPSMEELVKLNMQSDLVNGALAKLGLPQLWGWFLSSNEENIIHAQTFNVCSRRAGRLDKSRHTYVLPMLKIQL